jgi:hypothetical protein
MQRGLADFSSHILLQRSQGTVGTFKVNGLTKILFREWVILLKMTPFTRFLWLENQLSFILLGWCELWRTVDGKCSTSLEYIWFCSNRMVFASPNNGSTPWNKYTISHRITLTETFIDKMLLPMLLLLWVLICNPLRGTGSDGGVTKLWNSDLKLIHYIEVNETTNTKTQ